MKFFSTLALALVASSTIASGKYVPRSNSIDLDELTEQFNQLEVKNENIADYFVENQLSEDLKEWFPFEDDDKNKEYIDYMAELQSYNGNIGNDYYKRDFSDYEDESNPEYEYEYEGSAGAFALSSDEYEEYEDEDEGYDLNSYSDIEENLEQPFENVFEEDENYESEIEHSGDEFDIIRTDQDGTRKRGRRLSSYSEESEYESEHSSKASKKRRLSQESNRSQSPGSRIARERTYEQKELIEIVPYTEISIDENERAEMSFRACNPRQTPDIVIEKISLNPYPLVFGKPVQAHVRANVKKTIEEGAYAKVSVYKLGFSIVDLNVDFCEIARDAGIDCPVAPGTYDLDYTSEPLPTFPYGMNVSVKVAIFNGPSTNNAELACINVNAALKKTYFPSVSY